MPPPDPLLIEKIGSRILTSVPHLEEIGCSWLTLTLPMEANPLKPWKAEYAKSGRSSCKSCKTPIDKDQLRLGKMVTATQFDGFMPIGHLFYHCSFTFLDAPNMEFLFGLDMLRKHQCIIDLKENVLRVGGGEVSVPFLQEKDIPTYSS